MAYQICPIAFNHGTRHLSHAVCRLANLRGNVPLPISSVVESTLMSLCTAFNPLAEMSLPAVVRSNAGVLAQRFQGTSIILQHRHSPSLINMATHCLSTERILICSWARLTAVPEHHNHRLIIRQATHCPTPSKSGDYFLTVIFQPSLRLFSPITTKCRIVKTPSMSPHPSSSPRRHGPHLSALHHRSWAPFLNNRQIYVLSWSSSIRDRRIFSRTFNRYWYNDSWTVGHLELHHSYKFIYNHVSMHYLHSSINFYHVWSILHCNSINHLLCLFHYKHI